MATDRNENRVVSGGLSKTHISKTAYGRFIFKEQPDVHRMAGGCAAEPVIIQNQFIA